MQSSEVASTISAAVRTRDASDGLDEDFKKAVHCERVYMSVSLKEFAWAWRVNTGAFHIYPQNM